MLQTSFLTFYRRYVWPFLNFIFEMTVSWPSMPSRSLSSWVSHTLRRMKARNLKAFCRVRDFPVASLFDHVHLSSIWSLPCRTLCHSEGNHFCVLQSNEFYSSSLNCSAISLFSSEPHLKPGLLGRIHCAGDPLDFLASGYVRFVISQVVIFVWQSLKKSW